MVEQQMLLNLCLFLPVSKLQFFCFLFAIPYIVEYPNISLLKINSSVIKPKISFKRNNISPKLLTQPPKIYKFLILGKKFKGPDFVRKHIFNKHAEKVEEVKKEVRFFNSYLKVGESAHNLKYRSKLCFLYT